MTKPFRLAGALAVFALAVLPASAADFTMKFGTATFNDSQHQFMKFFKETSRRRRAAGSRSSFFLAVSSGRSRA